MNTIENLKTAILAIMTNNGLTEISLENYETLNDTTYVIWFANDGYPYEDPVVKIILENTQLSIEVEPREFIGNITLQDYDIDRIEWWQGIHSNILEVLEQDGTRRCPSCGKVLLDKQNYCTENCQKLALLPLTAEKITALANERIQELISLVAQEGQEMKQKLTDKYIIQL